MDMRFYVDGEGRGKMKERPEVHDVAGRFSIPCPTPWESRMQKLYFAAADGDEAVYFTRELQKTLVRVFRQMR